MAGNRKTGTHAKLRLSFHVRFIPPVLALVCLNISFVSSRLYRDLPRPLHRPAGSVWSAKEPGWFLGI
ncbi:hypothetical protein P692DRAFT_20836344 [Suillus brevipes Sb2]|nr:hypothetical protein P692DRAFT_20836344 [Suillus brevipes Sb2]